MIRFPLSESKNVNRLNGSNLVEDEMRLCAVCKSVIEKDRMEAIPATRLCAQHGRDIEKFGGEFRISASQERTSKQGSLKLNYGGISTQSTRNHAALEQLIDDFEQSRGE